MNSFYRLCAAALLFLGPVGAAQAAPALWQVSDGDSKVWLFGSFHALPPDLDWRTEVFDRTLAGADRVYFETDVGPEAQTAIVVKGYELGLNPLGTILNSYLDKAGVRALRQATSDLGLPVGVVQTMKPWLASNTISVAAMMRAGFDPTSGVDLLLQQELPPERKAYFESGNEQLDFLAGTPEAEQIGMLVDGLAQIETMPALLNGMVKAWMDGTPEVLAEAFLADSAGYEGFMQRVIYDRNAKWVTTIDTLLADNEQDLIVVGAGHLIGEGSVVDLLQDKGYRVERLQ